MTIREKLADWISGGALSKWESGYKMLSSDCANHMDRWLKKNHALKEIAAQETPSANETVKRMAKIAREALTTNAD